MKVYIAGRITGNPHYRDQFANAAALLSVHGHEVLNPAENPAQPSWLDYMRVSATQLVQCDAIYMLPRWWLSRGARIERFIAWALGMPRIPL